MAKLSAIKQRELTTMRKSLVRLALAGAAVGVLTAGAASAQIPAPPAPPAPPLPPLDALMAMSPDMTMLGHHFRAPDPEKRAQRLRDVLQLRPDQDRALKAYVEATSPKITMIKKEAASADRQDEPPTTLDRLDHMTKAADAMKARAEATRAFYLALTPSQQKTFDVLGMDGREGGGFHVHRFDTRGPAVFKDGVFKSGDRKVIIQRKIG